MPARRLAAAALLLAVAAAPAAAAETGSAVTRGEYLFRAASGCTCHTDVKNGGPFLAGGRPIKTPFGTFFGPNITPDRDTGIGGWSDDDFARAMRDGVAPDGSHYFPAFPYVAFTNISDADLKDLKAYLDAVSPVTRPNRRHDLSPPFGWRFTVGPWKRMFFTRGPYKPDPNRSPSWNRGAYLATALAHCGECHTPRTALGGLETDLWFAGVKRGPEGELAPNITPHQQTGIGRWSARDLTHLLKTGVKPDFDDVQGLMEEAVERGYKHLSDADLDAIAEYVGSLPPIDNLVEPDAPAPRSEFD